MPRFSFLSMEYRCYCCWKKGHKSPQCHLKDKIPQSEWAINKMGSSFYQEEQRQMSDMSTSNTSKTSENSSNKKIGWANTHVMFADGRNLRDKVILDSGSSTLVFCNDTYCMNIKPDETIEIKSNRGTVEINNKD